MLRGILPKEYAFYDYFDQMIDINRQISTLLHTMMEKTADRERISKQIKELERQADKVTLNCTDLLHKTFITPIDRNDIFTLIKRLDDLADQINAASFRISTYNVGKIRPEAVEFVVIIHTCIEELVKVVKELRRMKKKNKIRESCKKIHDLENQADDILREAIQRLFNEGEAMLLIKWKEIFERLEKAVDRCEDVASVIEGIMIDNS
jgi:uncharacterized protein